MTVNSMMPLTSNVLTALMDAMSATQLMSVLNVTLDFSIVQVKITVPVLILAQMEHMLMVKEIVKIAQLDAHHAQMLILAMFATITLSSKTEHACVNLTMKSLLDLTSSIFKSISSTLNGTHLKLMPTSLQDINSTAQKSLTSTIAQALNSI